MSRLEYRCRTGVSPALRRTWICEAVGALLWRMEYVRCMIAFCSFGSSYGGGWVARVEKVWAGDDYKVRNGVEMGTAKMYGVVKRQEGSLGRDRLCRARGWRMKSCVMIRTNELAALLGGGSGFGVLSVLPCKVGYVMGRSYSITLASDEWVTDLVGTETH